MKWAKTLLGMVVFLVVILFSIQNKDEVILRIGLYPFWNYQWEAPRIPLFLIILCSIFIGVLIGSIGDLYRHFQLRKTIRKNQRRIETLEKEIQSVTGSPRLEKSYFSKDNF